MNKTTLWLGWSGLIPFVALALLDIVATDSGLIESALALYAFGIISFLTGSWWRNHVTDQPKTATLVLSNVMFLLAFFSIVLLPTLSLLLLAVILVVVFIIEQGTSLIGIYRVEYKRMRLALTTVATLSLLIAHFF